MRDVDELLADAALAVLEATEELVGVATAGIEDRQAMTAANKRRLACPSFLRLIFNDTFLQPRWIYTREQLCHNGKNELQDSWPLYS
mgnify:CR=1 FL=1